MRPGQGNSCWPRYANVNETRPTVGNCPITSAHNEHSNAKGRGGIQSGVFHSSVSIGMHLYTRAALYTVPTPWIQMRDSFFGLIPSPSPAIMRFRVSVYGARARKGKLEGALIKSSKKSGSRYGFYTNNRTLSISTNSVQPLRSLNLPLREPGTTLLAFKFKFFLSLFERVFIYNEISSPSGSLEIASDWEIESFLHPISYSS